MDDLLEMCGASLPEPKAKKLTLVECGQHAPKAAPRFTEWSNAQSFVSEGYVARVTQHTCECCQSMRETFEGVFAVERKVSTGARRFQALDRGAQWPMGRNDFKCEVTQAKTRWCPDCIRTLGFGKEVEAKGHPFDIVVKES